MYSELYTKFKRFFFLIGGVGTVPDSDTVRYGTVRYSAAWRRQCPTIAFLSRAFKLLSTLTLWNLKAVYLNMEDENISVSAEHSEETNSVDSLGKPS